ncbi:uncharacterized protein LOC110065739 [Orbicella faveolata]|uniref:uncharacterized protein LOC110065739 n=1 Tax=Orbicella faveolata TaxID=48498 RepID=UPI0009E1D69D|nr:uncharacterized protein LOC110065739 [Orbicella faveolata]
MSLEFHITKMEKLATEKKELKTEINSLKKSLSQTIEERDQLYVNLGMAIDQIDDLEQYTRKHNLEIHGTPAEQTGENLAEQLLLHLEKRSGNVPIRDDDIDICHRLSTGRNRSKPRPTIVRFKSYRARKELYAARKSLKNQNLNGTFQGAGIVYANENLTRMRRELFA